MKTKLSFRLILALSACLLFSTFNSGCKKGSYEAVAVNTSSTRLSDSALLLNLSAFNRNHGDITNNGLRCSGFWGCLGKVVAVAGSDIVGAATGIVAVKEAAVALGAATGGTGAAALMIGAGVVVGAGASYVTGVTVGFTAPYPGGKPVLDHGGLNTTLPINFSYLSNTGAEHNTVLSNNFYGNQPIQGYYTQSNLSSQQIAVLNSPIMTNATAQLNAACQEYALNNFDFHVLAQRLNDSSLITSNIKDVLELFMAEYITSVDSSQMEATINYYINEVANSTISNDEKEALLASFLVAAESPAFFLTYGPVTINATNTSTKVINISFQNIETNNTYTFTLNPGTFELGSVPEGNYTILMTPQNYNVTYPVVSKITNSFYTSKQTYYATVAYGSVPVKRTFDIAISAPPAVPINGTNTTNVKFNISFKNLATNVNYPFVLNANNTFQANVPEGNYDVLMAPVTYNSSSPNYYKIYAFTQSYYATVAFGNLQVSAPCPIFINK